MDSGFTSYRSSSEEMKRISERMEAFNRGRTDKNGIYAISLSTPSRPYYAFWRIFPDDPVPLFIRTLATVLETAVERAFVALVNCNIRLEIRDNSCFEAGYGTSNDVIPFGKYRGKRLAEIYYIDPSYVLWLANKFKVENRRYEYIVSVARKFSLVHFELTIQKRRIASVSKFVGEVGGHVKDQNLTVLGVRLIVDKYRPDFYVDQHILAVDRDGNRFVFTVKAGGQSLSPYRLSCHSREIKRNEILHVRSAKVMSHYKFNGVQYTRLGYLQMD